MQQRTEAVPKALRAFLWLVLLALLPAGAAGQASSQAPTPEDYIGADLCGACHAEQMEQFKKTPMAVLLTERYPVEQRGCEACHGPGRMHAEAIGEATDDASLARAKSPIYSFQRSPKENSSRCLVCHQKDETKRLFSRSRHVTAGVACNDCHSAHLKAGEPESPPAALTSYFGKSPEPGTRRWLDNRLLRANQPQLCYSCHRDISAEFQLPVRHRVNEGAVQCSDCHNPHGGLAANELRGVATDACTACHVEKRGPFVFEHAPARVEGCTSCHTPHGSVNQHLLKRRQQRQLCIECHVAPEASNVPHPRLGFQAAGECTRCHIDIHGSNYQRQYLR